jgi:hypothetical protein
VEILAAALPAYRQARKLGAVSVPAPTERQPDFSVPAES